jgi:hypothetical protein
MRQVEMALESIQAPGVHAASIKRSEEDIIEKNLPTTQGARNNQEVTRIYSLEDEFMLSARYPR